MDAFLLKKLISIFVHPVPGLFLFMLICLVFRFKWPKVSTVMITLSLLILTGLSSPTLSNRLVSSLESKYPVVLSAPDDTALILVLADGHIWTDERPANTVMKAIALSRITEGVRLWKTMPNAMLATGGAKFNSPVAHAEAMNRFATEQGVPPEKTVQFPGARDTSDEIDAAMDYIKHQMPDSPSNNGQRLVVVSSAVHLARTELMLQEHGALYTMAPTDFLAVTAPWYRLSGYYLDNANRTMHEYVGMAWLQLQYLFKHN